MRFAEYLGCWMAGEGRLAVCLHMLGTGGAGLCGLLTGGEEAHVGGAAYAAPRSRSDGAGLTADVSTICGAGHKDVYAAEAAAKQISVAVNETVSIAAGIHVSGAGPDELAAIRQNVIRAAALFTDDYRAGRPGASEGTSEGSRRN